MTFWTSRAYSGFGASNTLRLQGRRAQENTPAFTSVSDLVVRLVLQLFPYMPILPGK